MNVSEQPKLPRGWGEAQLREIARVIRPRVKPAERPELPFVGMENVEPHTMRLLGTVPASEMKSSAVNFQPGDVLYGRLRPYLNKVFRPEFEGLCSAEFIPLTPPDGIDGRFVQYVLNSAGFVSFASHQHEGDRPRVDFDDIGSYKMPIPPLAEQGRIVGAIESHLTRLDSAVAGLVRAQANLGRYRASLLKAAVEGRLVPTESELARRKGRDFEHAKVLLDRILAERRHRWEEAEIKRLIAKGKAPKDGRWKTKYKEPVAPGEDLPDLPEGWCWSTVDQLTAGGRTCAYGVLVPGADVAHGVRFVRVGDIDNGRIEIDGMKRISKDVADKFRKTYLQGGEVLLTLVGTIGRTALVPESLAGANVARAVGVIPTSTFVRARWVESWFRSPEQRQRMVDSAHEVARKTLNLEDVRSAPVALPPLAEQVRLQEAVEDLESLSDSIEGQTNESLGRCGTLRQSILTWAFTGQLVDQDPTEEPADTILSRIRERGEEGAKTKGRVRRRQR